MSDQPIIRLVENDEVDDNIKSIFSTLEKSTGSVPKWVRVMANCPDIFTGFWKLFTSTMDNAPLDATLKWKVVLYVSKLNECTYCINVAEMKLKSFGLTEQEVKNLETSPQTQREEIALAFAKNVTNEAYKMDEEIINQAKSAFSDEELVELTAAIGLFNYINRFNDALNILPNI